MATVVAVEPSTETASAEVVQSTEAESEDVVQPSCRGLRRWRQWSLR